ncbi:MAG: class I SAM-dependent methyltransferase [Vicinamibacteria bacterium]|nr:class I SAM-dependent methyltransferase [Vicinamibacteria bacterium]
MTFDSLAASYDASFGVAPTGRLFRFRVAERVMTSARPGSRVLDIGCGTGEDAVWLAAQGCLVHGIDPSPKMIEAAKAKAAARGSTATFECRPVQSLATEGASFDAVISNFGALNCVPLETWAALAPSLLTASGRGFVSLMGRRPLPEALRRGRSAADRGRTVAVKVGDSAISVHYESVDAVRRALAPAATVRRVEALGCLVPGPGFEGFARRHPIVVGVLAMAEAVVRRAPFFNERGDHVLLEFERR